MAIFSFQKYPYFVLFYFILFYFILCIHLFLRERERERESECVHTRAGGGAEGKGDRESQAGSTPSTEPDTGLNLASLRS